MRKVFVDWLRFSTPWILFNLALNLALIIATDAPDPSGRAISIACWTAGAWLTAGLVVSALIVRREKHRRAAPTKNPLMRGNHDESRQRKTLLPYEN